VTASSDPRLLHKAIDDTRAALVDLCHPIIRGFLNGNLSVDQRIAPSLLDQLRRAVGNTSSSGGAPGRSAPIPISADALDLLETITVGARKLVELAGATPDGASIEQRLRAAVAAAGQSTDLQVVQGVRFALAGWVRAIHNLLDPPKRIYLAAPCPACGSSMVWRRDESIGEDVQQPALQVDGKSGCDCLACGEHWPPSLFEHLARVLGCPPMETGEVA
jgi:hypothetical protein